MYRSGWSVKRNEEDPPEFSEGKPRWWKFSIGEYVSLQEAIDTRGLSGFPEYYSVGNISRDPKPPALQIAFVL
jgi:hypothetical protein